MTTHDLTGGVGGAPRNLYGSLMGHIAATSMAVLVVIMVVQVFARYVLNASLIWAEELCRYILIWMTFLFIGIAFQKGEFVIVDVLTSAIRQPWRYVLKVLVTLPVLWFLWLMAVNGYTYASRFAIQKIPALDFIWMSLSGGATADISVFWIYVSVPVGCALLLAHMIVALLLEGRDVLFPRPAGTSEGAA
ncbi:TRAP-type C4-dicarboxylate transport system permease small subunit [Tepidamorphus gemmatus]|jgi:TRAP-type C4-dicarboxylate transport system permease small subunit|uniref:TRAP transporter small permease protein n=1 Tax=Tepidamorphus gemmatus TaxID=747076 RepID=A0A4R3M7Z6_9HYPH|nr:TRAP transporter small permease [Tepidamorphus gemmatus]TCT09186.1 TRAP-type C4-dicarboxylate transport system permease small subunit [Tepidamorphus gemmatus]